MTDSRNGSSAGSESEPQNDHRVFFACECCMEHEPESGVSCWSDIGVMPDGTWLCDNCYSDCDKTAYGIVPCDVDDFEFPRFENLPRPTPYQSVSVAQPTVKSGILTLDVEGWILSVRVHDGGYEVSITEDGKCPASHYVRLDHEQADTLRDFMLETSPQAVPVKNEAAKKWADIIQSVEIDDDIVTVGLTPADQNELVALLRSLPRSSAGNGDEPRIPLADHDEIGRAVLSQPWEVQKAIVTIAAHCTCIMDEEPSAKVADLVGCISQTCKELADALHATVMGDEPQSALKPFDVGYIDGIILAGLLDEWENGAYDRDTKDSAERLSRRLAERIAYSITRPLSARGE